MSNVKEISDRLKKYDLNEIVSWINRFQFKKVALQFPNELLCEAEDVNQFLSSFLDHVCQPLDYMNYINFNHKLGFSLK